MNLTKSGLLLTISLLSASLFSQTTTNFAKLNELSMELSNEWDLNHEKVKLFAAENNLPVRQELEDGTLIEMVDVQDGKPVYYMTDNLGAAQTTRAAELWEGGSAGLDLKGEGYNQLGEWDGGSVRASHVEFTDQGASRVTQMDGSSSTHYHATHVAGTMVAAGVNGNAKGMAYGGNLKAWTWTNDKSEMAAAAADGLEISNHSYGPGAGWENNNGWQWYGNTGLSLTEDYKFGFYDNEARQIDQIAYNAPYYLIVRSAGNERGEGPNDAGTGDNPEIDGGTDGYDCIQPPKLAKNVLTVGAALEVLNYTGPEDVKISGFSSFGPADDGRVKPDIVGKGVSLFSTMDGNNTDYSTLSGTSMSAPNVSGSMALLQSYYQSLNNNEPMLAATLRALVLHTADEAGDFPGPDYIFGWGLMNAKSSVDVINIDTTQNVIDELLLEGGEIFTRDVIVTGSEDFRVTICWTDPAGTPLSPVQLNSRTPMLVNDLDLWILDEDNNIYYPYKLDPDNPSAAATTDEKNEVDNVEMIFVKDPEPGTYTIHVSHDGSLENDMQAFSIIISGVDEYTLPPDCSAELETPENDAVDVLVNQLIRWEPAQYATSYNVYFGTDGEGVETPVNIFDSVNFTSNSFEYLMETDLTYYLEVIPLNNYGEAEGCNQIWSFTTYAAIDDYPYLIDIIPADVPDLPAQWQSIDLSEAGWKSTNQIGYNDNVSMMCFNPGGLIETQYDNWFVSPPFSVEFGKEYKVSYYFRNMINGTPESMALYWGVSPLPADLINELNYFEDWNSIDWLNGEAIVVPDEDAEIYLGWYATTEEGLGIILDEILIEDWGTVGVGDQTPEAEPKVYYSNGVIQINGDFNWNGAKVMVINMLGQLVYEDVLNGELEIRKDKIIQSGIHIVSISTGVENYTKKILVK